MKQTSLMRVEFKYENKAVPTESVAGTEALRCRGDDATRRDSSYRAIIAQRLRIALMHRNPQLQGRTEQYDKQWFFFKLKYN